MKKLFNAKNLSFENVSIVPFRLRREIFAWIYFRESFFKYFAWIQFPELVTGGFFANLSFIKVLYILIFSWLVLQLVVCESQNSYPIFSIFQIELFGYKRLNSLLNA